MLCLDLSAEMVRLCREKGLRAEVADLEDFRLPEKFDGVYANASLLHVPKTRAPIAVGLIADHLKPDGVALVSLKEGSGEGMEDHDRFPGTRRWFSYYSFEEASGLFADRFTVIETRREPVENKFVFLKFFLKLR